MGLSDDDVREILRIIDESDLDELRIETPELKLHVLRGAAAARSEPAAPAAPAASERAGAPPVPAPAADGASEIPAPMLGTFYRASAPGSPPFVDVGARVEPETVVCLIEVMKMMNPIPAGLAGTVVEVCVANGQLVEYGQPLFRVQD